jgi:ribonuclease-3
VLDAVPAYDVVGEGPDHEMSFEARVALGDETWGTGEGRSKKEAEQAAAAAALERLRNEERVNE